MNRTTRYRNTLTAILLASAAPAFATDPAPSAPILPGVEIIGEASEQDLAQKGEARLSIPTGTVGLVRANVQIWSRVGWNAGRLLAAQDPGPYPGLLRATGIRR